MVGCTVASELGDGGGHAGDPGNMAGWGESTNGGGAGGRIGYSSQAAAGVGSDVEPGNPDEV